MKKQSKFNSKIYFEHWKTPLDSDKPLHHYLAGILHAANQIYFFFGVAEKPFKRFHVMTLPKLTPYRVYEEEAFFYGTMLKSSSRKKKKEPVKRQSNYKFWNTPFIKEFNIGDRNDPFSIVLRKGKGYNVCHYVITTSDEAVEFLDVYSPPPSWEYYDNMTIKRLIKVYVTKKFYD